MTLRAHGYPVQYSNFLCLLKVVIYKGVLIYFVDYFFISLLYSI